MVILAGCGVALILIGALLLYRFLPRTVHVTIDDSVEIKTVSYETQERSVEDFLQEHKIDYDGSKDLLDTELDATVVNDLRIRITKAVNIPITVDGTTETINTTPVTVSAFLKEQGVTLGEEDIVSLELDHMLVRGDALTITRVTHAEVTETETTPYTVEEYFDEGSCIGTVELSQSGQDGIVNNTYDVVLYDGVEQSRTLIASEEVQALQNQVYVYGTGIWMGGAPSSYEKVIPCRAVSYYFDGNPHGSYGLPCTYGTIAVDPSVIPLGSTVYVEGYGYAIANDTGSAILGNTVDLYMESLDQCYLWGGRYVNVYIISRG